MNEQKRNSYVRKLVANARAIISYQVGLPIGCSKMEKLFRWLEDEGYEAPKLPVFKEYLRATLQLPIGSERLHCSRDTLRRDDERLVPINLNYREEVIDACFEIIRSYGEDDKD